MNRRGPRGLTPEEKALWRKVTDKAEAMHPKRPDPVARPMPGKPTKPRKETPAPPPIPQFRIGERRGETASPHRLAPPLADRVAAQPVKMDQKGFGKLKRGKLTPEGRIDLHGMTLDQAHGALNRFILDSHAQGRRLVLVITGKGKLHNDHGPIPTRRGVLKHQVPHWLNAPALSGAVLQIAQAHIKHGGSGAYYVYLRRRR